MKIYGDCKHCKKELSLISTVNTRVDFSMKHGKQTSIFCPDCRIDIDFHVDELYKKESKLLVIIALIVLVGGTGIGFLFLYPYLFATNHDYKLIGLLVVPTAIYFIIRRQEHLRVDSFNSHKLDGYRMKY